MEEDRNDIRVVYHREYPDTRSYGLAFTSYVEEDTLYVKSSMKVKNLILNRDYHGSLQIHVPAGHSFENITVHSKWGDVDLQLTDPLESLRCYNDMGTLRIHAEGSIGNVRLDSRMGNIEAFFLGPVTEGHMHTEFGLLQVVLHHSPPLPPYLHTGKGTIHSDFPYTRSRTGDLQFSTGTGNILLLDGSKME
ncbi:hypothetical protein [Anaerotalea alkaliphila]|uniref:Adhesin domain-containing protein n=1 Tax=Anaerotalea alkaliphila TaxID=2662126 RepID=A0A7X5KMQ2_9FIRM|nr:hypothetical protein [Anaerotalea alkaliphila]NDL68074.1 hypothetical protein [Anaerotalea alkaliphila]